MTCNQRLRISLMQGFNNHSQRALLSLSASVLWSLAVGSEAADIANANRVAIVVFAMSALHFLWSPRFNCPVNGNDIMIPAAEPTEGTMVAVDVRHPQCAALLIGRAMHDNQRYFPHKLNFINHQNLNGFKRKSALVPS